MYIEDILKSSKYKSGVIRLIVPDSSGEGSHEIRGLLDGDPSIKLSTSWGSIVPNMSSLSQLTQIINNQSVLSWVSCATGAWKGTEPLVFDISFYLVTFRKNQPSIKREASYLAKLCALYTKDKFATVVVHGGYKLHLEDANDDGSKYFLDGKKYDSAKIRQLLDTPNGLITAYIGDSMRISKLLIKEIDIVPSAVQVAKNTPLYIKINASFRTHRPMISQDLDEFFGLDEVCPIEDF